MLFLQGMAAVLPACIMASDTAVVGTPALITLDVRPTMSQSSRASRAYFRINVTGFTPPQAGQVEALVKFRRKVDASSKEVGRFGLFPNMPFSTANGDDTRTFLIDLDSRCEDIVAQQAPRVEIALIAVDGDGSGASLTVGRADLECR